MIGKVIQSGIAGLGNIASTHARAIIGHPSAIPAAASGRSHEIRLTFGEEFPIPVQKES